MDEHQAASVKLLTEKGGALCGLAALLITHKRSLISFVASPAVLFFGAKAFGFL
ncbi:hypothetical protein [Novosphingobium sp.]|jgi:hypothetical protein|uniref:hypothetical protein n=1 Tax=Novosphingobium sp. TaxID=1874826 RepID=UPI002FE10866